MHRVALSRYTFPVFTASLLIVIVLTVPVLGQPSDDLDYRTLNPRVWCQSWDDVPTDGVYGDWPFHFVNKRAQYLALGPTAVAEAFAEDCITIADNSIMGIKYAQVMEGPGENYKTSHAQSHEYAYAHTTDPATLTVFHAMSGANDVVELRWELDERQYELFSSTGTGTNKSHVDPSTFVPETSYEIYRSVGGLGFDYYDTVVIDWAQHKYGWYTDTSLQGSDNYAYRVLTKKISGDTLTYSEIKDVDLVSGSPQSVYWVERIWGEHLVNPNNENHRLYVQVGAYFPGGNASAPICEVRYPGRRRNADYDVTDITMSEVSSSGDYYTYKLNPEYLEYGGVYTKGAFTCRFFDQGDNELFEGDEFTTCPSNRIRSNLWFAYHPNVTAVDCYSSYEYFTAWMMQAVNLTVNENFDGMFGDAAENFLTPDISATPDYYTTNEEFENAVATLLADIQSVYTGKLIINGAYDGGSDLYPYSEGIICENFVTHVNVVPGQSEGYEGSINSGSAWLMDINRFNSVLESIESTDQYAMAWPAIDPNYVRARMFTYASFLLASYDSPRALFSCRSSKWLVDNQAYPDGVEVPIVIPEQMIEFGSWDPSWPAPNIPYDADYCAPDPGDCHCDYPEDNPDTELQEYEVIKGYFDKGIVAVNIGHFGCSNVQDKPLPLPVDETYYRLYADDCGLFEGGRIWTEPVSGTLMIPPHTGVLLMKDPIASPDVAKAAAEPLIAGVSDQVIKVRASTLDDEPMWIEIDDGDSGFGLSGKVPMTDAGGGLFATDLLSISPLIGSYSLRLYAVDESNGLAVYQHLDVEVVSPPVAKYDNRSDDLPLDFPGQPYSLISFDYDNDEDEDILITVNDGANPSTFYVNGGVDPYGVPVLDKDGSYVVIPDLDGEYNVRGASVADYDNDGSLDLFIAKLGSPFLLHNESDGSGGRGYVDKSSELIGSYNFTNVWHGAWSDINRDGLVDLYICQADETAVQPDKAAGSLRDFMLVNDVLETGYFLDIYALFADPEVHAQPTFTAAWADIEGDGDPDILVPSMGKNGAGTGAHLYVNVNGNGQYQDKFVQRFGDIELAYVTGVVWSDLDWDGYMDVIMSCSDDGDLEHARPRIFHNDGQGYFTELESALPDVDLLTWDVKILDHDLDGMQDLLLLSKEAGVSSRLYRNVASAGMEPAFLDYTALVDLDDSKPAEGALTLDLTKDGDPDLFLGRPHLGGDYYYSAVNGLGGEAPTNDWIGVRYLDGDENDLIAGTRVEIKDASDQLLSAPHVVDGGSGRGGQQGGTLYFGLGASAPPTVKVVTTWPSGAVQTDIDKPVGYVATLPDDTYPSIVEGSLDVPTMPFPPDLIRWEVDWTTQHGSVWSADRVELHGPPAFGDPRIYTKANTVTTFEHNPDGSVDHHFEFTTSCELGSYTIHVYSISANGNESHESKRIRMRYCLPGF